MYIRNETRTKSKQTFVLEAIALVNDTLTEPPEMIETAQKSVLKKQKCIVLPLL